jgi:hypothetical protein
LRWSGKYVSYSPCALCCFQADCLSPDSWVQCGASFLTDGTTFRSLKLVYKPFVKDIMDKYYEMFRGKNSGNKKDFFNSPDSPEHSDQDSDADGWTRLRRSRGLNEDEWVVCERLSFIKITLTVSHLLRLVGR